MKNTKNIRDALHKLASAMGSQTAVAAKCGVTKGALGDWMNGRAKSIRAAHWAKLQPLLAPYLQQDELPPPPTVADRIEQYCPDIDPLCKDIMETWDHLDPAAQNEILRIVSKYRTR